MALPPINLSTIAAGTGGFVINGQAAGDLSGFSVASAGDINGDGFDDIVLGAVLAEPAGLNRAGSTYVVFGKANGFAATINLATIASGIGGFVLTGQSAGDTSGGAVASAGDINGDGFDDIVIGASGVSMATGKSYVVFGKATGFAASINLGAIGTGTGGFVITGQDTVDFFGASVASAGDINGDGFDDLIIGAFTADPAGLDRAGKSYVVFGKATGFAANIDLATIAAGAGGFVINGQVALDFSGVSVASAGDINGDGFDDLIIGAFRASPASGISAGKSYVVFGKASGFAASINLATVAVGTGGFVINGQAANDYSGHSVASAGDVNGDGFGDIIVGASNADPTAGADAGKSYVVFGKAGGFGASIELTSIAAGSGGFVINGQEAGDTSGYSVASAGDINGDGFDDLIVGAGAADPTAGVSAGKSYVVFGKATGFSASIDLSTIAAGSGGFVLNGQAAADHSGRAVASAGDINGDGFDDLIVGALDADTASGADAGKSYVVFGGNLTGAVSLLGLTDADTLTGSTAADDIVGGQGNDILIGNGGADVLIGGSGDDVIHVSDVTFRRVAGRTGTDTLALDGAGITLDLTGIANSKLQGIERIDLTGSGNNSVTLTALEVRNLSDSSNALRIDGNAGDSVSLSGETWLLGVTGGGYTRYTLGQAILDVRVGVTFTGLPPVNLATVAVGTGGFGINGQAAGDQFGLSVASAGDINGDGFDDIIVGAHFASPATRVAAGKSYVVLGKATGFNPSIDLATIAAGIGGFVINGQAAGDQSGRSVASAGDINGDGFGDLIIGALIASPASGANAGQCYVVFGKASGFGAGLDLGSVAAGTGGFVINGQTAGDYSGRSVASAGDVNGDGFGDIIVGASDADPTAGANAGKSYVVFGKASGFGASVELAAVAAGSGGFVINGRAAGDLSGVSVASAGDINGDGFDDLIVGAFTASLVLRTNAGQCYVVFGKASGFGASVDLATVAAGTGGFVINGEAAYDRSGRSVASAGDINGDGFDDLIVGASDADPTAGANAGKSYVVFGKAGGFGASVELTNIAAGSGGFVINGQDAGDFSGVSVAAAGDINGDGFDDLIVGAIYAAPAAGASAGKSYVVFGKAGGFGASLNLATVAGGTGGFVINGQTGGDLSGASVASAGDINGDGFDDLIIGAVTADPVAGIDAGQSYVVFGSSLTNAATQRGTATADTLTGIAAADDIISGQGNDILIGNGGADVLIGGSGDDVMHVSNVSFQRVVGGRGTDTLALDGAGIALNLTTIANSRLRGIERIDLTGSGNNSLALTALEVLNLSDSSNTLTVLGNFGDTVSFGSEVWVQGATAEGFTVHTNGQASVRITTALASNAGTTILAIAPLSATKPEGSGGARAFTFAVARTGDTAKAQSGSWAVTGAVGAGTVPAGAADFVGGVLPGGTVAFIAGETSKTITVNVAADRLVELNERFAVTLSAPSAGVTITTATAGGIILNDDKAGTGTLSIARLFATRSEGQAGATAFTFAVTRSAVATAVAVADWAVTGGGVASTGSAAATDFVGGVLPKGTVAFAAGETSKTVTLNVAGDATVELDESFTVTLFNVPTGVTLGAAAATGIIYNDDMPGTGTLSIARLSASKPEGNTGSTPFTFTVGRTGSAGGTASADWAVAGVAGSGTVPAAASDFTGALLPTGRVSFAAGETSKTVTVNVAGDTSAELNESFSVTLSGAQVGVSLGTASATGVILDDDTIISTAVNQALTGTDGADVFLLGGGLDVILGKAGLDAFRFRPSAIGPAASNATTFEDFNRAAGERLDLTQIDAITGTLANDAFSFIGTVAFNGTPGQLRWEDQGSVRLIQGNVNGDTTADLTIFVTAAGPVDVNWFVL